MAESSTGGGGMSSSKSESLSGGGDELMVKGGNAMCLNNYIEAAGCFESALQIMTNLYGADSPHCIDPFHQLGYSMLLKYESEKLPDRNDLDKAFHMLDQARIISQNHSIHSYKLVNILTSLAQVFEDKDQFDTAFNHYLEALNLAQTIDPHTLRFEDTYFKMSSCLEKAGRVQEAIFYCENFLLICKCKEYELKKETISIWKDAKPIVSRKKILNAKLHDLKSKASNYGVGGVVIKENLVDDKKQKVIILPPSTTREAFAQVTTLQRETSSSQVTTLQQGTSGSRVTFGASSSQGVMLRKRVMESLENIDQEYMGYQNWIKKAKGGVPNTQESRN